MLARRAPVIAILVLGAVLLVFPFATGLFGKTNSVEKLTGDFRTTFTDQSLQQSRSDIDAVARMSAQLQTETLPALPAALDMTDKEFASYLAKNDPAVTDGVAQLDQIVPRFDGLVTELEAQQGNFERADSIPTGWLPSTLLPYLLVLVGLALVVLAARAVRADNHGKDASGPAVAASVVVGVVLVAISTLFNVQGKGTAVDDLTAGLEPYFTQAGADKSRADLDTVQALADELQADTIPALADALGMSRKEFMAFLSDNYPDVAVGVASLDAALPRFQSDVTAISDNVGSFEDVQQIPTDGMPTSSLYWWLLLPGLALMCMPLLARRVAAAPAHAAPRAVSA
ncbi:hypothetical protein [Nocardioides pelophilus]|uniref:hypothetical protein n=1 Tax=Nocardioides pelophilus TaxID=2172019 RepID=UPI0016006686|nr:hypothetical protein [Nocardioides pelophilus]